MNYLKSFLDKHLLIIFLLLNSYLFSDESSDTKNGEEKKEVYIEEIVKDFTPFEGYFKTYQDTKTSEVYIVIEASDLGKEFIYFAHVAEGIMASGKVRGSYEDYGVFTISKHFETLRLERVLTSYRFDPEQAISKSSGANTSNSAIQVLPIKAYSENKEKFLINITGLLLSESLTKIVPVSDPDNPHSDMMRWGNVSSEKSRIRSIHNYPKNTDFQVEYVIENPPVSYSISSEMEDVADPRNISIIMRYSFIEMPQNDFKPRLQDQLIGYFSQKITDYSSYDATPYADLLHKWNLQKKNPEMQISEPIKPITFWIENTTPLHLRDYIKKGVLAWNEAFIEAGFKNALEVKIQPDDADWDAGDIRYNVLRWTSSPDPLFSGYGPSFVNPRTGEILGADIMLEWGYLTYRYKIDDIFNKNKIENHDQCYSGNILKENNLLANLKNVNFDDPKFLEQSIIRLTLHEIGHTLGLNHNFKGSYLHNIEDIHNTEITGEHGVTSSVMEYPAINLAPLGVKQGDYYDVKPGKYDKWAIKFGYSQNLTELERKELLSKATRPEYMYAHDDEDMRYAGKGIDPRAMVYDLTNNPIDYAVQRIKLVKALTKELPFNLEKATTWEDYRNGLRILLAEQRRSLNIISRYIGGVYVNRSHPDMEISSKPLTPVDYDIQKKAMEALAEYSFSPNAFEINEELLAISQIERRGSFIDEYRDYEIHKSILNIQNGVLNHILNAWVLARISDSSLYGNQYSVYEVLDDLTTSIFEEDLNTEVSSIRRNLQTTYVRRLITILGQDYYDEFATAAAYNSLRDIEKMMKRSSSHKPTQAHRKLIHWIIDSGLNRAN